MRKCKNLAGFYGASVFLEGWNPVGVDILVRDLLQGCRKYWSFSPNIGVKNTGFFANPMKNIVFIVVRVFCTDF